MNTQETYQELMQKNRELIDRTARMAESSGLGSLEKVADEIISFAQTLSETYQSLRSAGTMTDEVEEMRSLSFFWSVKYKQITGKVRFFPIVNLAQSYQEWKSFALAIYDFSINLSRVKLFEERSDEWIYFFGDNYMFSRVR